MNLNLQPEPMPDRTGDPSLLKLERQIRDLEAQLRHARQDQVRIKHQLQARLLDGAVRRRDLEARLHNALAELDAVWAERDRLETQLANAMVERVRLEKNYENCLVELGGVYASLSWRLTVPLRGFNAQLARWRHR